MSYLFHLTTWPYAGDEALQPVSLSTEGFVHLSSAEQLLRTANRWYADSQQVGLLVLQTSALGANLRWEDLYDHGEEFPHLYGAIPLSAVSAVVKMTRDQNGYHWPEFLTSLLSPLGDGPALGEALIEPKKRFPKTVLPPLAVLCFFPRVMAALGSVAGTVVHKQLGSAIGPDPILTIEYHGQRLAVCFPGVGGPLAAVALEELIAHGCQRFVMCGGAGGLQTEQPMGQVVLVSETVRDEGLSHHYLEASHTVTVDPQALDQASRALSDMRVDHQRGTSWTTDALYRETPERISRRKAQGCLTVEMEVASLLAVAQFRGVPLVPLLLCGDDLSGQDWDFRDWTSDHTTQDRLFWLAAEVVVKMGVG